MKCTVGYVDRYIRVVTGTCFLLQVPVLKPGIAGTVFFAAVGSVLVITGLLGFCLLYALFGIDTR